MMCGGVGQGMLFGMAGDSTMCPVCGQVVPVVVLQGVPEVGAHDVPEPDEADSDEDSDADDVMVVLVERMIRNEGTILVFEGRTPDGEPVHFGVDRRSGVTIVEALAEGEVVMAEVPAWAVLSFPQGGNS